MNEVCSGKHSVEVTPRAVPHPAVTMTKRRADEWRKHATDEDFYVMVDELANLYQGRHTANGARAKDTALFMDYKKWKDTHGRN